ncbi:MAG: metal ABC transporter substrate-binding protein [Campylobacterota bacterium]|nr:metal ABC transporter substrate-binding protein [Campylobacterota bacterium]
MKKIILALTLLPLTLLATIKVAVSYPYIGAITEKVGGKHVSIKVLAPGSWDPHFVVPRPSLIAKLRNADALIMNGGELEIGWLPALIKRANNSEITGDGTLDLSQHIQMIEVPKEVSRAGGDVHADGNPHFHLDPHNIVTIAEAVTAFLSQKDPDNAADFRQNLETFKTAWQANLAKWSSAMQSAKGKKVVQYHGIFNYFLHAYNIDSIGTIEPLPGIAPSSRHTMELIGIMKEQKPCCILHDVYHPTKTGQFIAKKSGIPLIVVPHDIGALDNTESLEALFEHLVRAIIHD